MTDRLSLLLEYRKNDEIDKYRAGLKDLTLEENVLLDLYLRKAALGELGEDFTGYPSLDKPWLKYYNEEYIKADMPHMTAVEYLKKSNENNLDLIAINSTEKNGILTYRELFAVIDRTAASLEQMGVHKGDIIMGILPPTTAYEVYLLYAADIIGAAVSFMHEWTTKEEICNQINEFSAEYFFTFEKYLSIEFEEHMYDYSCIKNIVITDSDQMDNRSKKTISWRDFLELGKMHDVKTIDKVPEDLLFIAKTGGTTGKPKNVMLNDNSFNIPVHQLLNSDLDYNTGDKWLRMWSLFSATAAIASSHLALCAGMENILRSFPASDEFDKLIVREKPNHIIVLPVLLDYLEESTLLDAEDLSFIKSIGVGGTSITNEFEQRANAFFQKYNMPIYLGVGWGCTENSSAASIRMNFETAFIGKVGVPLLKTVVGVFEPDSTIELGYGQEGEMCIRSHTPMMGYYNDTENLSAKTLKVHEDGFVWVHTGDLGSIGKDGIVTIKGRMTRVIFTHQGNKLYPAQMEGEISQIPGVKEIAVIGVPDKQYESFETPVCFAVIDKNYKIDEARKSIETMCRKNYSEVVRPKHICFKESIPITAGGKPDIQALKLEWENGNLGHVAVVM